jgi:hypothetical protein
VTGSIYDTDNYVTLYGIGGQPIIDYVVMPVLLCFAAHPLPKVTPYRTRAV